ncbi:MAG: hypothetical protein ACREHG_05990 [Candidatus Saccharimonadales bacterium]
MGTVYFYESHTNAVADANSSPVNVVGYTEYLYLLGETKLGIGVHGPYDTLQDLYKAWPKAQQTSASPIPGSTAVGGAPTNVAVGATGGLTGALGAFEGLAQAITDGSLWRSLGWIIMGVILLVIGITLWLKENNVLPEVVPIPV